ncbi:MAG TPA: OmpA family protein [Rhizomicrobium sp.]|jgi:outer membrane protein OmpA-like peptidoglycan-associated protein|nr:OmpA family protein [Rhizomicrobium sp.]
MRRGLALMAIAASITIGPAGAADDTFPVPIYDSPRMVFFDPRSAALSDKADEILVLAVQIARHYHAKSELVVGYCDRAEIAGGGCHALALRRARAVKAKLVELGLSADMIQIRTSLEQIVPPGEDASQALNRHVLVDVGDP